VTRSKWPVIRSSTLYHVFVLGLSNIHVTDASTTTEQVNFLRTTRDSLGVSVYFSTANLSKVEDEFNSVVTEETKYCDFVVKTDTEEVTCNYDEAQKLLSVDRLVVLSSISNLVYSGSVYKVGLQAQNRVRDNCSDEEDTVLTASDFSPVFKTKFKTLVTSTSYKHTDLGGHTLQQSRNRMTTLYVLKVVLVLCTFTLTALVDMLHYLSRK